jgi:uncharacterized protein YjbI with pentapeptide repeats
MPPDAGAEGKRRSVPVPDSVGPMSKSVGDAPTRPQSPADFDDAPDDPLADGLEWHQVRVRGDFSGQTARAVEVTESRLVGSRLVGVEVERLRIADTVVEDCDLSGAVLVDAVLTRVELRSCRMSGLVAAGAHLRDVRFLECKLDDANFRMTTSERVEFDRTILRTADFYAAKLRSARFSSCDLALAQFSKADLRGARLHGSALADVLGADSFAGVVVETGQVLPLALRLFAALGITVDDDREERDRS